MSVENYTLILTSPSPNGIYDLTPPNLGEGTHILAAGSTVQFEVIPGEGWIFSKWILRADWDQDGIPETQRDLGNNPQTFSSGTANITFELTPVFTKPGTYNLFVLVPVGNGTMTPEPYADYQHNENDQVILTATPNTGAQFINWLLDGLDIGSYNPLTLIMDKNHTIQAVFSGIPGYYTLILESSLFGSYDDTPPYIGAGTHQLAANSSVSFNILPNAGYVFEKYVLETDIDQDGIYDTTSDLLDNPETFGSGTTDITYKVTPVLLGAQVFNLTILAPDGEGVTAPSVGNYLHYEGEIAPVQAIAVPGVSSFSHWVLDGADFSTTPNINVTMDADHTLQAVFKPIVKHTLTIDSDPDGISFILGG